MQEAMAQPPAFNLDTPGGLGWDPYADVFSAR